RIPSTEEVVVRTESG
nr:RecName: Full=Juvenile hormone esterase; Short=JH esterase [Manduca sexta]